MKQRHGAIALTVLVVLAMLAGCYPVTPQPTYDDGLGQQGGVGSRAVDPNILVYRTQGGDQFVVRSGGEILVEDGGAMTQVGDTPMVFEGSTDDTNETTFAITDPTADRTITFPNSTGTVALNPYGESIEFEGATANDFETTLAVTDPTADRTLTLPDETAAVMVSSLTTNATDAANAVTGASNGLVFEGATANNFETTLSATDPTADRSVVFADGGGTVMLSSLATNATDAANAVTGASNALVFEGATANDFETSVTVTDPTADRTVTIPNETAAVMVSSLTTNATDAANAVTGASNGLVFEGATANDYEATITPTDPTADRTITLQDATGTVALTSQNVDMTITAVTDGGNAGAKNEYIGLPRIKLVGGGQGTNPGTDTKALVDDSPTGEFAPVDADVTEAEGSGDGIYKYGASSYKATFAATATEDDGFVDAGLGGAGSWEDLESVGLLLYSNTALTAGDLQLVLTDDGGARKFDIPAVASANVWTWVEVDISSLNAGTGDSISDVAITLTAGGATNLGEFTIYLDIGYGWDATDEEALGAAIQQDGVLSVVNTESGASLAELTDYFVHYESGNDFIVYITDQSTADVVALIAY